jgi:hypothetical protein
MGPKSGNRFSENPMRKQESTAPCAIYGAQRFAVALYMCCIIFSLNRFRFKELCNRASRRFRFTVHEGKIYEVQKPLPNPAPCGEGGGGVFIFASCTVDSNFLHDALVQRSKQRLQPILEKSMHKQKFSALSHERSECVSALGTQRVVTSQRITYIQSQQMPLASRHH